MGPGLSVSGSAVSMISAAGRSQVAGWKVRILDDWSLEANNQSSSHSVVMLMCAASGETRCHSLRYQHVVATRDCSLQCCEECLCHFPMKACVDINIGNSDKLTDINQEKTVFLFSLCTDSDETLSVMLSELVVGSKLLSCCSNVNHRCECYQYEHVTTAVSCW